MIQTRYCLRVLFGTVFREHCRDNVDHDIELRDVSCSNIYENIPGIQGDFTVLRVNNRRH